MKFWLIFGSIAITNLLIAMLSFRWGYTEGKLEMIETMLKMTEERRGIYND